ncbi:MAG: TolC family protein [Phycisphaerae bacterium]|nr:TolC family protein [Phycisphaerae bacterium]
MLILQFGCSSPDKYRVDTDKAAAKILAEKQLLATGKTGKFTIEKPSDTFRRRLLAGQRLATYSPASLGTDKLKPIEHWPVKKPTAAVSEDRVVAVNDDNEPVVISLVQALQIGAYNSFDYQTKKEEIFQKALALELERDAFRNTFNGQVQNLLETDTTSGSSQSGMVNSGEAGVTRKLQSGVELGTSFAVDLANLFTLGQASSMGFLGDATVSIPLLRGSGKHIVTEPLTQAERNVLYAFWAFEQYKKQFAVDTANKYLSVLQGLDAIKNSEADYRSRMASAQRSRRLADAGRIQEIEVDQAVQNELSARQRWISATQSYKKGLDAFKIFLGLPPDAKIELAPNELETLVMPTKDIIRQFAVDENQPQVNTEIQESSDLVVELLEPDYKNAGPLEIEEPIAVKLAFANRFDLKATDGKVYDAQRAVVVAADALGAELTLFGSVQTGARRNDVGDATSRNAQMRHDRGVSSALLTLDLPIERTAESLDYRNSFIALEQAVRDVQQLEDSIKSDIRNAQRDLLEARERMGIQAKSVYVAQKRVKSVNMFLEAGRAQIRDLLEAQDALLSAQNSLTAAVVNYRIAELNIQRDMGVLRVDEKGLWQEYVPGGNQNVQN